MTIEQRLIDVESRLLRLEAPRVNQGHGSRACYARGCRKPECIAANAEYARVSYHRNKK